MGGRGDSDESDRSDVLTNRLEDGLELIECELGVDGEGEDVVAEVVGYGVVVRVGRVWAGPPGEGRDAVAVEVVHEGIAVVAEDREMEGSVVSGRFGQGGLAVR